MSEFGVTDQGFIIKPLSQIADETAAEFQSAFGAGVNLDPRGPLGQIKAILDERMSLLWQLAQAVYLSQYPNTASGIPLDNAVALTGIIRKPATRSTCSSGRARGVLNTPIPAATVISVYGASASRFQTDATAEISIPAVDEVQTIAFSSAPDAGAFTLIFAGQETVSLSATATAAQVEAALEALANLTDVLVTGSTSTSFIVTFQNEDGGKNQPLLTVGANTLTAASVPVILTITETTPGDAAKSPLIAMTAQNTGPVSAPMGSLTVIDTPVVGLESFTNEEDADVGEDIETDADLKIRRVAELHIYGTATVDAVRSKILDIADVDNCFVFQNNTDATDSHGRPAHSVDCIVQGGAAADIAEILFQNVAAGISFFGSISESVYDQLGFPHTIKFSRPTVLNIWLTLTLTTNSDYPGDGDTEIVNAIMAYGATLTIGEDVIVYGTKSILAAISAVPGVTDVAVKIGVAAIPADGSAVFTASDSAGDLLLTSNGHGLIVGNQVTFSNSGGALPTGLTAGVVYWVIWKDTNTFKVSTTRGGDSVAYTNAGTGTHTVYWGGRSDAIVVDERELAEFLFANITVIS